MSAEHHTHQLADAQLSKSIALPNGAASVVTAAIDLEAQVGSNTAFLAACELKLTAPVLTTAELPDTKTMTYIVETDNDVAFGSLKTLHPSLLVQTGAGAAGDAAATARMRLPSDVERYVRIKATNSGLGDATGKTASLQLLF